MRFENQVHETVAQKIAHIRGDDAQAFQATWFYKYSGEINIDTTDNLQEVVRDHSWIFSQMFS